MTDGLYIVKPQAISRDKRLTSIEQDYLCLIAYYELLDGCTASNKHFALYFGVSRPTAVEVISRLKSKGFIETIEEKSGGKTIKRTITIIDADSRNCLLSDSRKLLLLDSRKLPAGIVGNSRPIEVEVRSRARSVITYDGNTKRLLNITELDIELWTKAYPHLNIESQIRKMEVWLDSNPTKRPKSNYKRFITGWLARSKNGNPESADTPQTREISENEADALFKKAGIL